MCLNKILCNNKYRWKPLNQFLNIFFPEKTTFLSKQKVWQLLSCMQPMGFKGHLCWLKSVALTMNNETLITQNDKRGDSDDCLPRERPLLWWSANFMRVLTSQVSAPNDHPSLNDGPKNVDLIVSLVN